MRERKDQGAGMGIAAELRGPRVINARGYSTKVGGSVLAPEVVAAMSEAAGMFARIEDLQEAAGAAIVDATGAEAGYVTAGAAAGLTLAAAAAIARLDPGVMNRLPDTTGIPAEIVMLRRHRNDYDHALRAAGARLVEVGFHDWTFDYEVEQAIGPQTCGVFYLGHDTDANLSLADVSAIAHRTGVPVIVDGSVSLPPAENLRALLGQGADLVSFSGGKHIQGPQASGILAGRKDLLTSVALQHQDMDVYPDTWPARGLIADRRVPGPPHHGLGRGLKVGKEEIVGLVAALRLYLTRDYAAERERLTTDALTLAAALDGSGTGGSLRGVTATCVDDRAPGRPGPWVRVTVDPEVAGMSASELIVRIQERDPRICCFEGRAHQGVVGLFPDALAPGEADEVVTAIRTELGAP